MAIAYALPIGKGTDHWKRREPGRFMLWQIRVDYRSRRRSGNSAKCFNRENPSLFQFCKNCFKHSRAQPQPPELLLGNKETRNNYCVRAWRPGGVICCIGNFDFHAGSIARAKLALLLYCITCVRSVKIMQAGIHVLRPDFLVFPFQ